MKKGRKKRILSKKGKNEFYNFTFIALTHITNNIARKEILA
jgi:hypothetical protein